MSMTAVFVQVEDAEIRGFEADPDSVEALFVRQTLPAAGLLSRAAEAQERLQAMGPEELAARFSRLPEPLRQQLESSLARAGVSISSGQDLAKLLGDRLAKRAPSGNAQRETLDLEKAWHGVHYVLAGAAEPGPDLRSQAVLGGVELGEDPEGFSGYGPARYFRAAQVRELSEALGRQDVESAAEARFDPEQMERLEIYPGWEAGEEEKEWVMGALRRLRDFYRSAAAEGRAVVTCLV